MIEDVVTTICDIEEMPKKIKLEDDVFYTIKEFSEMRGCSMRTAQAIFDLKDFPSEDFGKNKVALGSAIKNWYQTKRTKYEN